jgi:hypothetical protein
VLLRRLCLKCFIWTLESILVETLGFEVEAVTEFLLSCPWLDL